jgi:hypothetical protein
MTPILGIMASQISGHLATVFNTSDYESISTVTVGSGGSSSISFSSISSSYKHLQIRGVVRDAGGNGEYKIELNGDTTTTNYYGHVFYADGSSVYTSGGNNNSVAPIPYSGLTSSVFGATVMDILDYANTNKYKTLRTLNGYDTNSATDFIGLYSKFWKNTAAVNAITLRVVGGTNFAQYTSFALYGIKG